MGGPGLPPAATSPLEGLEECFTINHLGALPSLSRCLVTTKRATTPEYTPGPPRHPLAERGNGRRWIASAIFRTDSRFNKIMGYRSPRNIVDHAVETHDRLCSYLVAENSPSTPKSGTAVVPEILLDASITPSYVMVSGVPLYSLLKLHLIFFPSTFPVRSYLP